MSFSKFCFELIQITENKKLLSSIAANSCLGNQSKRRYLLTPPVNGIYVINGVNFEPSNFTSE
eukprot:snap_masked-scaffold_10-processed-gene-9.17-mRNA-1 protein AED:1.00 eAED:1.00 QI:0/0/0/0/1/1/2/0/62